MIENGHILFYTERGKIKILLTDIFRIKACKEYSIIYTKSGKYMVCRHLKYIEKILKDYYCFFRPNKSEIINMNQIKKVTNGKLCAYILNDGFENNVSRRKKILFLESAKLILTKLSDKCDVNSFGFLDKF